MIKNSEPISIAEASEYLKGREKEDKMRAFVKKFAKTDAKTAKELRKKLEGLDLIKMRGEQIAKIIDMLPEDSEDLNKIFAGISLEEDETKKILGVVSSI